MVHVSPLLMYLISLSYLLKSADQFLLILAENNCYHYYSAFLSSTSDSASFFYDRSKDVTENRKCPVSQIQLFLEFCLFNKDLLNCHLINRPPGQYNVPTSKCLSSLTVIAKSSAKSGSSFSKN